MPAAASATRAHPERHTGRPVLLLRPDRNESDAAALRARGIPVVVDNYLRVTPAADPAPAQDLLARLQGWDGHGAGWLVVTSPRTYQMWATQVGGDGLAVAVRQAVTRGLRVLAVGAATAASLPPLPVPVATCGTPSAAGALAELTGREAGMALLPGSRIASPVLAGGLAAAGWDVHTAAVYDTVTRPDRPATADLVDTGAVAAVLLRSPSAVRALAAHCRPGEGVEIVAVGPVTAAAAAGHPWQVTPVDVADAERTAEAVAAVLAHHGRSPSPAPQPGIPSERLSR